MMTERMRAALKEISDYRLDCGCSPCMGQCYSKELLRETIIEMADLAKKALQEVPQISPDTLQEPDDIFTRITRDTARSA